MMARRSAGTPDVSILVIVDLARRRRPLKRHIIDSSSFNPCYRGSCSSTSAPGIYHSCSFISFQSLLSWILLVDSNLGCGGYGGVGVSILVIVDLARRLITDTNFLLLSSMVSILVIVDLARRPSPISQDTILHEGFNPCYRGSCSSTTIQDIYWLPDELFQSLLSWILLVDNAIYKLDFCNQDVSILVIVDLARRHPSSFRKKPLSLCFNPCYRGSCSSTRTQRW